MGKQEVIKKPSCVVEYSKYVKSLDRGDEYLSCYSILRKAIRSYVMYSKLCSVQSLFCLCACFLVQNFKPKLECRIQTNLNEVWRMWIIKNHTTTESSSGGAQSPAKESMPWGPKQALNCR